MIKEGGQDWIWPGHHSALVAGCYRLVGRVMTEVADGNSVTMSTTQDISPLGRPEGFVSSRLSPCSNSSLGVVNDSAENAIEPETDVECGFSGKVTADSNILPGESAEGHDEVTLSVERWKVSVGGNDLKASPGSPQCDLQDVKDSSIEEPVLDAPKAELVKDLPAVEISAVKISALEISIVETYAVETPAVENLAVETHAIETSYAGTYAMDLPCTVEFKEEATHEGESIPVPDKVQDMVPDVKIMGDEVEDVTMKVKSAGKDFGGEQESLPSPSENERRDVASESTTVNESPLTGVEDAGQQLRDQSEVIRNGETRMDEAVSATNHTTSLSTTGATKVENEVVNSIIDYTTGRTVEETSEKFTEDTGDKLVDEVADRMANKLADGVADKMADAIADEIADQIADRMADEIADKMADEMADGIADDMADRIADEMADRMADEMADRMADEMADRMADEMAAKMADELADEMADEVIEGDYGRAEEALENERMDDGETQEVGDMEEEEMAEDPNKVMKDDDYEDDEGTPEEQISFVEELERFFKQRSLEYKAPKFYGLELNVLK